MWWIVGLLSFYVVFSSCLSPYDENDRVTQSPKAQLQDDGFSDQKLPWHAPKFFYGDLFARAECQSEAFCSSSYASSVSLATTLGHCFGTSVWDWPTGPEGDTNSLVDAVICAQSFSSPFPVGLYSARLTTFSP